MYAIRITVFTLGLILCFSLTVVQAESDELRERLNSEHPLGVQLTIEEVVHKFEESFNKKLLLPMYIPFDVTHRGGYFSKKQKMVCITYYNDDTQEKMKIYAFYTPQNWRISGEIIELKDGTKATYHHDNSIVDSLFMERGGVKYIIGVRKPVKLESLIKVASSLE